MKYTEMTSDQMLVYVKGMDVVYEKNVQTRNRLYDEIKGMQERKEILPWEEIASAIAYPKAASDKDHVGGGSPDEFKLLHQAERINKIYRSQMEELLTELEDVETQIARYQYVSRCITHLEAKDREIINLFTRKNLTFAKGSELFHMVRSTIYKMQKKALDHLTEIYNAGSVGS